jgi:putative drug exporter of the RND superfamily
MTLLGDRAWWLPRWLDRIIPDIQLEGGPAPEPETRESPTVEQVP